MTVNEILMKSELGMAYTDAEHDQIIEWLKELKTIRSWKRDVIESFIKYDASSLEELISNARSKNIYEFVDTIIDELEEELNEAKCNLDDDEYYMGQACAFEMAISIIRERKKEECISKN